MGTYVRMDMGLCEGGRDCVRVDMGTYVRAGIV